MGATVTFNITLNKRGQPQATQCIIVCKAMKGEDARAKARPNLVDGPYVGVIKSYTKAKGFGFIQCAETHNVSNPLCRI